jgi:hypothetical protein
VKVILGLIFLLLSGTCVACQCAGVPVDITDENADYVYLGRVVSAKLRDDGRVENTLKPIEVIKGNPDQWKFLSNAGPVRRCSTIAAVGLRYIVYGRYGETPELYLCSYTQHYDPEYSRTLEQIREAANK